MAIKSYSWVQRRVRTLNLATGTKYTPSEIIRREKEAQKYGYTTQEYQDLFYIKATRADVKRPAGDASEGVSLLFHYKFAEYARYSPQIKALLDARPTDLIDNKSRVWREIVSGGRVFYENQATHRIETTKPAGAQPVTERRRYDALKAVAEKAKTIKGEPASVYEELEANIE